LVVARRVGELPVAPLRVSARRTAPFTEDRDEVEAGDVARGIACREPDDRVVPLVVGAVLRVADLTGPLRPACVDARGAERVVDWARRTAPVPVAVVCCPAPDRVEE